MWYERLIENMGGNRRGVKASFVVVGGLVVLVVVGLGVGHVWPGRHKIAAEVQHFAGGRKGLAAEGLMVTSATVVPQERMPVARIPEANENEEREPLQDVAGLKLGTTLALLTQAYANGGIMARNLANVADDLAAAQHNAPLARALSILRNATPEAGPITATVTVMEAQRVLSAGAPDDLPEGTETTSETTSNTAVVAKQVETKEASSWWRRQLERFVTIRRGDEPTVDSWTRQLRLAQDMLARGNASDALVTLTTPPLSADNRLDVLRSLTQQYLDQQGKLLNAINAYVQAYLAPPNEQKGK